MENEQKRNNLYNTLFEFFMKERVLLLIVSLCLAAGVLQAQTK